MKQLGISVTLKYTKAMPDGSFKSLSMSTDAQLEEGDDESRARRLLYLQVAEDLRACFTNNAKKPSATPSGEGAPLIEETPPPVDYPQPPMEKGTRTGKARRAKSKRKPTTKSNQANGKPATKPCPIHGVPTKLWHNDNGGSWHSHLVDPGDGGKPYWCNGKPKKGKRKR